MRYVAGDLVEKSYHQGNSNRADLDWLLLHEFSLGLLKQSKATHKKVHVLLRAKRRRLVAIYLV